MEDKKSEPVASSITSSTTQTPKVLPIKTVLLITTPSIIIIGLAAFGVGLLLNNNNSNNKNITETAATITQTNQTAGNTSAPTTTVLSTTVSNSNSQTSLVLDTNKNYGNKYANGLLPVGDKKYVTNAAKKGYVFECNNNFVPESQAGAQTRGPWFTNNNTQWNINKKVSVGGNVMWQHIMKVTTENGKRLITTNDLPNHKTGIFPVATNDPAYKYDRNPNTITDQNLTYTLESNATT